MEQKFKIGDKVIFKGKAYFITEDPHLVIFAKGKRWVYYLHEDGKTVIANETDLTLATIPQEGKDATVGAKKREKRGKK